MLKRKNIKNALNKEHSGAVAIEYVIIIVIMAVVIFAAFNAMGDAITKKADEISNFISNNGQSGITGQKK